MDPVTHAVIGMSISKLAGNNVALFNAASMSIIIGSMFPDSDIVLQKWGDYIYLKNHRGASHSVLGIFVSSMLIAVLLSVIYRGSSVFSLFGWAMIGCLSHCFFDLFSSYGAKILWPLTEKKFSLSLLIAFDPIIFTAFTGYVFAKGWVQYLFLAAFVIYMIFRVTMRNRVNRDLYSKFSQTCKKISILPSMTGLFRWHFILEEENCNVVGEENILKGNIKIIDRFKKIQDGQLDIVMYSPVGEFFSEFTPLFHVAREKTDGITRYTFIDLRYYIRRNFLHHAVLELDKNNCVVRSSFNPYSMNRSIEL